MPKIPAFVASRGSLRGSWLALASAVALWAGGCSPGGCDRAKEQPAPVVSASPVTSSSAPVMLASMHAWDPTERAQALAAGKAVLDQHQCARCHHLEGVATPRREDHCTSCHVFLKGLAPDQDAYKKLVAKYGEPVLQRYQRNIQHLMKVPDLEGVARRVRTDWIASFLAEPYDLRPGLEESMIRHNLSPEEIKVVVRYLAASAQAADPSAAGYVPPALPPRPDEARLAQGQKLFLGKGCTSCHTFGNLATGVQPSQFSSSEGAKLAPNLRFVRDRTHPDVIVDWLLDPQKVSPGTLMPALGLTRDEALLLRDFLFWGDPQLQPLPADVAPVLPPAVARPVAYEEMKEQVLGKVCVHCHMNDYEKDTGPGNKGGFGYKGLGLAMRTYEALVNGAVDEKGQRYSVLVPRAGEQVAPILQAMLRRRVEERRDHVAPFADHERPHYAKGLLGMPMGLPSMSDEAFGLLRAWIEQGCPGPTRVTGVSGINDGYLTPDGPLRKNQGCELRPAETPRPEWTIESEKNARPGASGASSSAPAPSGPAAPSGKPPGPAPTGRSMPLHKVGMLP